MKKISIFVLSLIFLFSFKSFGSQMRINDNTCYMLSFATIAYSTLHLYGRFLTLGEDDTIYFKENGKIVGMASNKIGHILIEAPEEKCQNAQKPEFSRILQLK